MLATFRQACAEHGVPAFTLTDNGMVFTTRHAGDKGGRNGLETELARLGVAQKNSRPNHPTTCDLGVRAGLAVGAGEPVVGEVGLPGLVRLVGCEANVGGLGALVRLRDDQA